VPGGGCFAKLNCSVKVINELSLGQRTEWVDWAARISDGRFGTGPWFNNIKGVVQFMDDHQTEFGKDLAWFRLVDAGILQGVQDGLSISMNGIDPNPNNAGGQAWATFFNLGAGRQDAYRSTGVDSPLYKQATHAWGTAEQLSTDYGFSVATAAGLELHSHKLRDVLVNVGNWYRATLAGNAGVGPNIASYNCAIGVGASNPWAFSSCNSASDAQFDPRDSESITSGAKDLTGLWGRVRGWIGSDAQSSYSHTGPWADDVAIPPTPPPVDASLSCVPASICDTGILG
jgi:hypothetical protein